MRGSTSRVSLLSMKNVAGWMATTLCANVSVDASAVNGVDRKAGKQVVPVGELQGGGAAVSGCVWGTWAEK